MAPMKRFLGLLEIDSQDVDYMKVSSVDLLASLTARMYEEEIARVQAEMKERKTFSLGIFLRLWLLSYDILLIT